MTSPDIAPAGVRERYATLSPRQKEVCQLIVGGLMNKEIARQLNATVHTVKAHRAEVMRRMEARSVVELVNMCQSMAAEDPLPLPQAGSLRVIVVEDDPILRYMLTAGLGNFELAVTGVADGAALDKAWSKEAFDVVVLDLGLGIGKEDGMTIANRLRARSACGIVMVTARGQVEERIQGLHHGADAYFVKPVNVQELAVAITNLGRRVRAR